MGDVAKRAGVATITVSRAFRAPEKVNAATRQKIREAVEELGYVLDETAGALSAKRTRTVCAVVSTLDQSVFSSTVDGLTDGAECISDRLSVFRSRCLNFKILLTLSAFLFGWSAGTISITFVPGLHQSRFINPAPCAATIWVASANVLICSRIVIASRTTVSHPFNANNNSSEFLSRLVFAPGRSITIFL